MRDIPDKSIDMILCDLPYGITARNKWDEVIPLESLWKSYKRVMKDNAAIVLFGVGMFTANLMCSNSKWWKYNLIWEKTQPSGFLNAHRMPLRSHEDICVFYYKAPTYNPQMSYEHTRKVSTSSHGRNCKSTTNYGDYGRKTYDSTERFPKSIIDMPPDFDGDTIVTYKKDTQKSALHPTQKPVALLEYLIKTYTNPGEIVLDNCMGSGSTGVACINTGRKFIGIELDQKYFGIATKRISDAEKNLSEA